MKNHLLCCVFLLLCLANKTWSQNMAINSTGALPDASAMVDIASTDKGFLAPRMTTTQQNAIVLPAKGLVIYNTTNNVLMLNTGTSASPVWTALTASSNNWLLTGNSGASGLTNFLGTTDNVKLAFRTNNLQRMLVDSLGRVGIGVTNPANPLVVKDTIEIRRTGSAVSQLLFTNTSGSGDFRISGDGGDLFWQGGGGRNLQMGSYWGITLAGDRQSGTLPSFINGVANTGILVKAQRDASVPLAIQSNSASQSANLTEWRNSAGTILNTVNSNGNVAIGASAFNGTNPEKLLVDAGTTTSVNAIVGKGSINSYLQLNIQNGSSGTNSSSDVVATANNGDETNNYVDMGINGGGNTSNIMGAANDAYLYNMGKNFMIGTGTSGKVLMFLTGGLDSATNERMRIDGTGNVGIGVGNPAYKLTVNSTANPLQLVGLQTGTNADSVLTVSNGVIKRLNISAYPVWTLGGNTGTTEPAAPATYGTSTLGASENFLGTEDARDLVVATNNRERMRILNTNGFVGIGTAAPSKPLDLVQNLAGAGLMKIQNTNATGYSSIDIWSNTAQIGNIGYSNSGASYANAFYFATNTSANMLFATNNAERLRIDGSTGNIAVGATAFNGTNPEKLLIDAGVTTSVNAIVGKGSINSYLQLNIQNGSAGTNASSDVVATANNGDELNNFVDLGINGGGNTSNIMGTANDAYLYNMGKNFMIGTGTSGKALMFLTGGLDSATNERMRIDGSGNVGIGAANPVEKLVVSGNIIPKVSGSGTVGTATYKWNAVYATNGTIQTSDRRMKTNIIDLKYGLKEIIALRPVSFNWKTEPNTNNKVGLIAQEVKAIVPEVVSGDEAKETLGLNYAELVPVLVNAIKEQQKQIDELKQKVKELKNKR
ncbi:MAG: tail fiber domain-containing protein [Ferruginibacter sp.]